MVYHHAMIWWYKVMTKLLFNQFRSLSSIEIIWSRYLHTGCNGSVPLTSFSITWKNLLVTTNHIVGILFCLLTSPMVVYIVSYILYHTPRFSKNLPVTYSIIHILSYRFFQWCIVSYSSKHSIILPVWSVANKNILVCP